MNNDEWQNLRVVCFLRELICEVPERGATPGLWLHFQLPKLSVIFSIFSAVVILSCVLGQSE